VIAVAWSHDSKHITSAGYDGTMQVWDAADGGHVFTYPGPADLVRAVAWSPDGKRIASVSDDGTVQVWDAADGGHVFTYLSRDLSSPVGNLVTGVA
jgi:WD40 repeat protein